ncbi:FAD-dependent oxidoreductase [Mycolicibacter hiberniae]|uniref:ferredoxin--NADP(+) reductase n=1 Tax=Mycolicibacter hiberniae TaxID=29314 RepID=A0A7I7X0V5_9MYCO|nr:FAD-dependent oxidoreductase [Mycolicibacter hiberniae]MCV7086823.1 FAD-dependent oxidoreductase [Mycolicibacter hiberniae]ORV70925.1 ferredoxin [Mycolicibacter hiberniae]BBZ21878.1 putative ferredoxin/ferredoxin--NADP reductase [Mycolicibacter hiberniae]
MPHVITQACCNDASCVFACPVNCIHPTPDEPGFATSEMLYIDPDACVDCGACVRACPVDAIVPHAKVVSEQLPFVEINKSFYPERPAGVKLPPTSKLAPVLPAAEVPQRGKYPLTVAIVGSGPAAMYAADELLTQPGVLVNMFEKLPTPYGLVRAGVAPDHQRTKLATRLFDQITRRRGFQFFLNVEVGRHLSHADLLQHHHAVLYASGALHDKRLEIDGMGLPGTGTATEIVGWYNGHPDFAELSVDLSGERVVIVGNGNVALDVARILTADPDRLAHTDIADYALAALRDSAVQEVVIVARRGPVASAFTLPELVGLTQVADVVLDAEDHARVREDLATVQDMLTRQKLEVLAKLGDASAPVTRPRIRFAYGLTPARVLGDSRCEAMEFTVTGTDQVRRIDAGMVLTSIGYHGTPIADLPFDDVAGVVPNEGGRVIDPATGRRVPGAYVSGWIKRGTNGFIGSNKADSLKTIQTLASDYNAGLLTEPVAGPRAVARMVHARQPDVIDAAGWKAIDQAEVERGQAQGRPRVKFTRVPDMLDEVKDHSSLPLLQNLLGALRRR